MERTLTFRAALRLAALAGVLLSAAPLAGAQPRLPDTTASQRIFEGFVSRDAPTGEEFYYFKYVRDSVLVLGEGLDAEPRFTLPHEAFLTLLRGLHSAGALRDTVALRYALDAQFAPAAPDDLAVSFQAPKLTLLTALALALALVAVVVLYRRARRERAERERERTLRLRLAEAREAERSHFARELHDGPLQDLCAIQLALARLPGGAGSAPLPPGGLASLATGSTPMAGEGARTAVNGVAAELRGLCDRLRPPALETAGLPAAVEALAQRVARQHPDLHVACHVEAGAAAPVLPPDHQLALFRVAQEALANAARHAGASHVEVALTLAPSGFRLFVDDDGTGPPARDVLDYAREGHYGLLGMSERADLLGAVLAVGRSPLGGTRIAVTRSGAAGRVEARRRPAIPRRALRRQRATAL